VVKEVASLGIVVVMALLFLVFLATLRPSAIAVVQGDTVIDVASTRRNCVLDQLFKRSDKSFCQVAAGSSR
jgi:hypothetical protein